MPIANYNDWADVFLIFFHLFLGTAEIINPMEEKVYVFMKKMFQEVYKVFPDPYVHLGMDEVYYDCWWV